MIKESLIKCFSIAYLVPLGYTLFSGTLIYAFDETPQVSEYFQDDYQFELYFLTLYSFFAIIALAPIFLNVKRSIAENRFLSMTTWFLLPISSMVLIAYSIFTGNGYHSDLTFFYHTLSIIAVYSVMLYFSFWLFHNDIKNKRPDS